MEIEPPPPAIVEPLPPRFCARCGDPLDAGTLACARCAAASAPNRADATVAAPPASPSLGTALVLYVLLLGTSLAAFIAVRSGAAAATAMLVIDGVDTLLVFLFVAVSGRALWSVLRNPASVLAWAAASLAVLVTHPFTAITVRALIEWLGLEELSYLEPYRDAGFGLPVAILSMCIQPAIVEELAFRGVILGALRPIVGPRSAILVSAVLFAILHLSIPSFPHLLVLGIILGVLRTWSGSLYPGMLLHFLHNGWVVFAEIRGS